MTCFIEQSAPLKCWLLRKKVLIFALISFNLVVSLPDPEHLNSGPWRIYVNLHLHIAVSESLCRAYRQSEKGRNGNIYKKSRNKCIFDMNRAAAE